jgi:hypothetical protein
VKWGTLLPSDFTEGSSTIRDGSAPWITFVMGDVGRYVRLLPL